MNAARAPRNKWRRRKTIGAGERPTSGRRASERALPPANSLAAARVHRARPLDSWRVHCLVVVVVVVVVAAAAAAASFRHDSTRLGLEAPAAERSNFGRPTGGRARPAGASQGQAGSLAAENWLLLLLLWSRRPIGAARKPRVAALSLAGAAARAAAAAAAILCDFLRLARRQRRQRLKKESTVGAYAALRSPACARLLRVGRRRRCRRRRCRFNRVQCH